MLCLIADVDECQSSRSSSPCNALSEYCVNSIGSYILCISNENFTKLSGQLDGKDVNEQFINMCTHSNIKLVNKGCEMRHILFIYMTW